MSARWARRIVPVVALAVLAGCNLNLDAPTLVKTPRILAIVADPPEAAPGEDVAISVMAFDPMGRELSYAFEVCFDAASILDADNFDPERAMCFPLEDDGFRTMLSGERTALLSQILDSLTPAQTGGFSVQAIRTIVSTAGFPLRVQVDVLAPDGTVLVSGHKLVGITTREARTHNPPPPFLFVNDVPYVGGFGGGAAFDCLTLFPEPVLAGSFVSLQPGDDAEAWIETFPIYDFTGDVRIGEEGGYYSWYATGGTMPVETTTYPREGVDWLAPEEPGTYRLWYVVRDGHLGTSGCTFELEVRDE
jgi:hypothetical protein